MKKSEREEASSTSHLSENAYKEDGHTLQTCQGYDAREKSGGRVERGGHKTHHRYVKEIEKTNPMKLDDLKEKETYTWETF